MADQLVAGPPVGHDPPRPATRSDSAPARWHRCARSLVVAATTLLVIIWPAAPASGTSSVMGTSPVAGSVAPGSVLLRPPVVGVVVRGFGVTSRYGPGHRGVDLAALPGTVAAAPASGTVTFAGVVVGSRWVTIDHGRIRTTVGPLRTIAVGRGDRVRVGQRLGTTARAHGRDLLHLSARVGDRYVDPLRLMRPPRVSLVPVPRSAAVPGDPAGGWTDPPDGRYRR